MDADSLAEQEQPVQRRVALKVVKAGLDSARIVARFEQEWHSTRLAKPTTSHDLTPLTCRTT
jgi:hypothetical protein